MIFANTGTIKQAQMLARRSEQQKAMADFEKAINRLKRAGITTLTATLTKEDLELIRSASNGVDELRLTIRLQ